MNWRSEALVRRGGRLALGLSGLLLLAGCGPAPDLEEYRQEILAIYEAGIQAHLDRDPDPITRTMADPYLSVSGGEVRALTAAQNAERYGQYLGTTRFTQYRSLADPVIGFSDDGSLAWLIARVRAEGVQTADDGTEAPLEFTAAWITLFARRDGVWVRLADAANLAAPTE